MPDSSTDRPARPQAAQGPLLALTGIHKSFGGAAALRDVDFDVVAGEVHALVGMNGAGKSTLVGVISGAHVPDDGVMVFDGELLTGLTPRRAREHGIATVPQKRDLVGSLTVAENLFLGDLPRVAGVVSWGRMMREAQAALRAVGVEVDPRRRAGALTAAEQTMVEIAREVHRGGRVLVLDEPTASLGGAAAMQVRALVKRLRDQGRAVVYISHHLDEILDLADRVTVLRDGRRRLTVARDDLDIGSLVYAMVGEHVDTERPARERTPGEERLRIDGLTVGHRLQDASIDVRAGEVVAVLGPAGDGQSDLFAALTGLRAPDAGTLRVDGVDVPWRSVRRSLASGLRCVTGDRLSQGLVVGLTVDENITMAQDRAQGRVLVNWGALRRRAADLRARFGVTTLQANPPVGQLSGGNQQKVLLGKWLESAPRVCFLEEPTNGVDVAAKAEIHRLIDDLAAGGSAVLLASSDVAEVQRLADRIAVVSAGRVLAVLDVADASRDQLVALTVGDTSHD
ncbi:MULTISPECIES: sugar ABC transporter ATP-binding protein [unclassified Microbacterium]|uniref:sugar ABC transporter ATP-binding protein n=1 Tax=unclassified Microbacterium TaxID=2609290 RepID=UPI00214AD757|nr:MULTISPECIES: sugar ABC transporter ATP-binding protein [unclassified Microbacterium]MCR2783455.1 sugar ABC transporter ATP-binding protein [Microbacterium sp. zg.B96]MDL5351758.1 sugar ABC transporter ATP-binding protein [Microbacterium sp. zg-YB36]WIM15679.1 sugar ABC transporter ATP-binding protein [Microbacterium sp. zg-B96]